jgi:Ca2+-binding EF-hand superfamily protein
MEKIELTLLDVLSLEAELNGVVENKQTTFAGLLSEELSFTTKYRLTKLAKELSAEAETINNLKIELIKKYGEEGDGKIEVKQFDKDGNTTEEYTKYIKELFELFSEKKEFSYTPISLDEMKNVVTSARYNVVNELIRG